MDFSLSEEQEILRKAARDFLSDECPLSLVREMAEDEKGYSPGLWRKIADLGWLGLPFPGKYGGSGGSFLDLTVLLEEMGRARLPGPFFSTVVLGGLAILEGGSESQKKELLPGIVRGDLVLTLALAEPGVGYNPEHIRVTAEAEKGDYVISGTKLFVSDAHIADCIVCAARTEEDGISWVVENLLSLVDSAKSENIILVLENHYKDRSSGWKWPDFAHDWTNIFKDIPAFKGYSSYDQL